MMLPSWIWRQHRSTISFGKKILQEKLHTVDTKMNVCYRVSILMYRGYNCFFGEVILKGMKWTLASICRIPAWQPVHNLHFEQQLGLHNFFNVFKIINIISRNMHIFVIRMDVEIYAAELNDALFLWSIFLQIKQHLAVNQCKYFSGNYS